MATAATGRSNQIVPSAETLLPSSTPRRGPADELRAIATKAIAWSDWLQQAARLTTETLQAPGVFLWEPIASRQGGRLIGLNFPIDGVSEDRRQSLKELAELAISSDGVEFGLFGSETPQLVAAVKLPRAVLPAVLLVPLSSHPNSRSVASLWLPLVAASAELWSWRHEIPSRTQPNATQSAQHAVNWSRTKTVFLLSLIASAAMALPVPYSVNCDCELQPVTRRFVASPFEGALEKAFVEIGDTVNADQLLARMDGKEVRWEQAGNFADYERAAKERDAQLADQKVGEAQLSKLQMERLALTSKLLEHRGENLEIRSPIDGIVVSGELKRAEGARLSMGQTLFEIAPLDQMIVEVEIPESELAHVVTDGTASIRLEAFPNQKQEGLLKRICPRAELRRKQQVFIGEITLSNESGQLRPGMRGRVSLPAGQATLGWRLFHRAWNKLQLW